MNEYIVLFKTLGHAHRAGLEDADLREISGHVAVRILVESMPWEIVRECFAYILISKGRLASSFVVDPIMPKADIWSYYYAAFAHNLTILSLRNPNEHQRPANQDTHVS